MATKRGSRRELKLDAQVINVGATADVYVNTQGCERLLVLGRSNRSIQIGVHPAFEADVVKGTDDLTPAGVKSWPVSEDATDYQTQGWQYVTAFHPTLSLDVRFMDAVRISVANQDGVNPATTSLVTKVGPV